MTTHTSLTSLLCPKSVAIIGVSRSPAKVGYQLAYNVINSGFKNSIYLINPSASHILDHRVYSSLNALPLVPELAIIVTPAPIVIPIITECIRLGVKSAIIVSAGFAESGESGHKLQDLLSDLLKNNSISVLGPNCLGLVNPYHSLNAAFGPLHIQPGPVFLISQSGALITSIFDFAKERSMGFSAAISLGNRLNVNENDLLDYAAQDPNTKVIAVYLESFANAKLFFKKAAKITSKKPIIFLKGGSSSLGQQASASHTAALATNSILVSAFCRQTGIIESESIENWLNTCHLLSLYPKGIGSRLAIISNAGGPAVLATDYASKLGIALPELSETSLKKLSKMTLPSLNNPLDLLGDALPDSFSTALNILNQDPHFDALYGLITPQSMTQPVKVASVFIKAHTHNHKPTLISFMGGLQMTASRKLVRQAGLPTFDYPNDGLQALSAVNSYFKSRSNTPSIVYFKKSIDKNLEIKDPTHQSSYFSLLRHFGFTLPRYCYLQDYQEIPEALNYVGRPAIAKTGDPKLSHKVNVHGVVMDLMTVSTTRLAFRHLQRLHPEVLLQQTVFGQIELILGAIRDPQLGPFITVGLGGSFTNLISERTYIFIPSNLSTYKRLLNHSKTFKLCEKFNLNLNLIYQSLDQLAEIILTMPEIREIEINPLIITKRTAYAVDIKINF